MAFISYLLAALFLLPLTANILLLILSDTSYACDWFHQASISCFLLTWPLAGLTIHYRVFLSLGLITETSVLTANLLLFSVWLGPISPWIALAVMGIMFALKFIKMAIMPVAPSPDGPFFTTAFVTPIVVLKAVALGVLDVVWPWSYEYDIDSILDRIRAPYNPRWRFAHRNDTTTNAQSSPTMVGNPNGRSSTRSYLLAAFFLLPLTANILLLILSDTSYACDWFHQASISCFLLTWPLAGLTIHYRVFLSLGLITETSVLTANLLLFSVWLGPISPWIALAVMGMMFALKFIKMAIMPVAPSPDGLLFIIAFLAPIGVLKAAALVILDIEWPWIRRLDIEGKMDRNRAPYNPRWHLSRKSDTPTDAQPLENSPATDKDVNTKALIRDEFGSAM
ncbi:hypothetical protein C8J56DRAFT_1067595 [Mycena floridula]|nr:hypothetical protein C8J56DRAFT_1068162 [Mycena floridula]KAJ7572876.1 hypothetical protein C8J56DRAFT_1067595 [Mycena floridula]